MRVNATFREWVINMWDTIFPDLCFGCNQRPKQSNQLLCPSCWTSLPYTDHFSIKENEAFLHLKGRVNVEHVAALLFFNKEGIVRNLIHGLKYQKKHEVARLFAELSFAKILDSTLFVKPDIVVPVPLHREKLRMRGYNQSDLYGRELAKLLHCIYSDEILLKIAKTSSQTGKSRIERVNNLHKVLEINEKMQSVILDKNVLLVDDVLTTGATLEACCLELQKKSPKAISVLTMALATGT